jgi:hypothetical protein
LCIGYEGEISKGYPLSPRTTFYRECH